MLDLINKIKTNELSVWVEDGAIKLAFGADKPSEEMLTAIKASKPQLLEVLENNQIFSKHDFWGKEIFSVPESEGALSFAQERMLFIEQFEQGTDAYHIPYTVELSDDIQFPQLVSAFQYIVDRHPVLKSCYQQSEEGQFSLHESNQPVAIPLRLADSFDAFKQALAEDVACPFELDREPPLRLIQYKVGDKQYLLMLWHHIAFDGWSTDIFLRELSQAYTALKAGKQPVFPALEIDYCDYAFWQRHQLESDETGNQTEYWKNTLSGFETLALPTDFPRPSKVDYRGNNVSLALSSELSNQLKSLAREHDTTLYVVMLSAFYVALATLSGQEDQLVGTPSDNRHLPQTQDLIGFFATSLVLRAQVKGDNKVSDLIKQVHEVMTSAKANQDVPFERLIDVLNVERDMSRHPLFQVMFGMQSFGHQELSQDALPFESVDLGDEGFYSPAKFDLTLHVDDGHQALKVGLDYAVSLFELATAERILALYQQILTGFVRNAEQSIAELDVLTDSEKQLFIDWNQTEAELPVEPTWHRLFEAQAQQTPDAIALVHQEEVLTYQALNEKANQLANTLRETYQQRYQSELKPDTPVALFMERSSEMLIAILAVLKAGGAYVPVSPEYPKERAQFIFEDTAAPLVLTQQSKLSELDSWLNELPALPELIAVDSPSAYEGQSTDNLDLAISGNDLAYVIYTSGTTGKPKGVMMPHSAYADFIHQYHQSLGAQPVSLVSLTQYTFDIFGLEYGLPLLSGGTVYLSDIHQAPDTLSSHALKTNVLQLTPSVWSVLQVALPESVDLSHITVIVGGESGSEALYQSLSLRFQKVIQVYGPTEACIWSTQSEYQQGKANLIGTPLNNESCYVLSTQGKLCPIGVPGELHIGGVGLARGYLNREALTQERFITSPIAGHEERLYKTGDLVRWRHDGQLEYIGRNDFQVKIRGHRIELGEIEAVLLEEATVQQAVVIDREKEGEKYLAAYIVSDTTLDAERIRQTLSASLPDFMVPSTFTQIDAIPLTMNGKLDRRALPEPEWSASDNYTAPETELEIALCGIWQEVLGAERVGIHDSFFQVGGNSINAIKVVSQINRYLGHSLRLELVNLYTTKTIGELAQFIEENQKHSFLEEQDNEMSI
ncbi:putative ANTIBIOTIC SYNTHETASE fused with CoA-dependent acyltransferase [Vibrio nigripulchritudo]|uniref:Putative ANTIBIOTIC SYNTHETASE fused with CoA-dependent acyltransferase n=4 Tax=Vibrio nigripulchritudo TaxID=28173 RepID=U4KAE5_9VIBR|nr:non-ribosomal peptide synthetase [Vibrio nigripulchritudo]CCO59682.1 putative ANTIBIOTIC SYNTHETASE fused with CoA-dependent acyltransferase [Vibrio nigripulchritudo]